MQLRLPSTTAYSAAVAAVIVASTLTATTVHAQVTVSSEQIVRPAVSAQGEGLNGVFFSYNLDEILRFSDFEDAPIIEQFCSRVQVVNFYDVDNGEDPLDSYVRNNQFERYVTVTGIQPPAILQADGFLPSGTFFSDQESDTMSANFFGYINIAEPGQYEFCIGHDDGGQLTIGDSLVLNEDYNTAYQINCALADIPESGMYPIVVRMFDSLFQAGIAVFWRPPGVDDLTVVPQSVLFPTNDCYGEVFLNDDIATRNLTSSSTTAAPTVANTTAVPTSAPTSPTAQGDPHFKTWSGHKYSYHGACDLILLSSHSYDNNNGLDIHIRTKHRRFFSYIASAVVRIGNDVVEVTGNRRKAYFVNGVEGVSMPAQLANGRVVTYEYSSDSSDSSIGVNGGGDYKKVQTFTIHLNTATADERIVIKTWNDFVSVTIENGTAASFGDSVGLMGTYTDGTMVGRDGMTVLSDDVNAFGQEWMLQPSEAVYFHQVKKQQQSQQCPLPSVSATDAQRQRRHRRLGEAEMTTEMAEKACAHVSVDEREFCIFDVLAMSDASMAGAY